MNVAVNASSASKVRLRLWLRMLKATHVLETELRDRLRREFGTTLPRFDVLAALDRHPGGLRMTELSGVLKVSNGNVTGIVDRLEAEGHVARQPVEGDRRALRVALTEAGAAHFTRLAAEHEAWVDELLGAISAEEAGRVMHDLSAITERLGGAE